MERNTFGQKKRVLYQQVKYIKLICTEDFLSYREPFLIHYCLKGISIPLELSTPLILAIRTHYEWDPSFYSIRP